MVRIVFLLDEKNAKILHRKKFFQKYLKTHFHILYPNFENFGKNAVLNFENFRKNRKKNFEEGNIVVFLPQNLTNNGS